MVRSADEVTRWRGHIDRRSLLKIGGLSAAGAALLSACGIGVGGGEEGVVATTTTTEPSRSDIAVLQTATTLETLAIQVYDQALASGVLTTTEVAEAVTLLAAHHKEHQSLFAGETSKLGGRTSTDVNATLQSRLQDQTGQLRAEQDVLRLALDIERALAATYQANTAAVEALPLRTKLMSVGGVEARHTTLIGAALGEPLYPADGFHTTDGAVPPGT